MSDTDKTRPWRVKEKDDKLAYDYHPFPGQTSRWPKWWIGESRCGCPMCTDQDGRKVKNRKERYEGKKQARNYEI